MMFLTSTGETKFECKNCLEQENLCLKCARQKSIYILGKQDRAKNLSMNLSLLTQAERVIYIAGYNFIQR